MIPWLAWKNLPQNPTWRRRRDGDLVGSVEASKYNIPPTPSRPKRHATASPTRVGRYKPWFNHGHFHQRVVMKWSRSYDRVEGSEITLSAYNISVCNLGAQTVLTGEFAKN